jgi:hypothetical protein
MLRSNAKAVAKQSYFGRGAAITVIAASKKIIDFSEFFASLVQGCVVSFLMPIRIGEFAMRL